MRLSSPVCIVCLLAALAPQSTRLGAYEAPETFRVAVLPLKEAQGAPPGMAGSITQALYEALSRNPGIDLVSRQVVEEWRRENETRKEAGQPWVDLTEKLPDLDVSVGGSVTRSSQLGWYTPLWLRGKGPGRRVSLMPETHDLGSDAGGYSTALAGWAELELMRMAPMLAYQPQGRPVEEPTRAGARVPHPDARRVTHAGRPAPVPSGQPVARAPQHEDAGKPTLAFAGFGCEAGDDVSREFTGRLNSFVEVYLLEDGGLPMVERQELDRIRDELGLAATGVLLLDDTEALRLGKMVGADLLLYGTVRNEGGGRVLTARLAESRTGAIRHNYVRGLAADDVKHVAAEVARLVPRAAVSELPQVTLAVAPFRQQYGFGRFVHLQNGLQRLLVRDFETLGTFTVLEREDLRSLLVELDLARTGHSSGAVGSVKERSACFLLSGEFEEFLKEGRSGIRLTVQLEAPGGDPPRRLVVERTIDRLGEVRMAVVNWVVRQCKAEALTVQERRVGEFDWLLKRAIRLFEQIADEHEIGWRRVPGIEVTGVGDRITAGVRRYRWSDGAAFEAVVSLVTDTLEAAMFVNPDDMRTPLLLGYCLARWVRWKRSHRDWAEVPPLVQKGTSLLADIISRDPKGPFGACARRFLPLAYRRGIQELQPSSPTGYWHTPAGEETKNIPYRAEYIASLVSQHDDMPAEFLEPSDVDALRKVAVALDLGGLERLHREVDERMRKMGPGASMTIPGSVWLIEIYREKFDAYGRYVSAAVEWAETHDELIDPEFSTFLKLAGKEWREEAVEYLRSLRDADPRIVHLALLNIGHMYRDASEPSKAIGFYRQAAAACKGKQDRWFTGNYIGAIVEIAKVETASGRTDEAKALFEEAFRGYKAGKMYFLNPLRDICLNLEKIYIQEGAGKERIAELFWTVYDKSPLLRRHPWLRNGIAKYPRPAGKKKHGEQPSALEVTRVGRPGELREVTLIVPERDALWLLCSSRQYMEPAVCMLDVPTGRVRPLPAVGRATCMAVAPDVVWVGSRSGLTGIEKDTGRTVRYSKTNGLPSDHVSAAAWSNRSLYLALAEGPEGGILRMDGPGVFTLLSGGRQALKGPEPIFPTLWRYPASAPRKSVSGLCTVPGGLLVCVSRNVPGRRYSGVKTADILRYSANEDAWEEILWLKNEIGSDAASGLIWKRATVVSRDSQAPTATAGTAASPRAAVTSRVYLEFFEPHQNGEWAAAGRMQYYEGDWKASFDKPCEMPLSAVRLGRRIWFSAEVKDPNLRTYQRPRSLHRPTALFSADADGGGIERHSITDDVRRPEFPMALAAYGDVLYVGTDRGIYRVAPAGGH